MQASKCLPSISLANKTSSHALVDTHPSKGICHWENPLRRSPIQSSPHHRTGHQLLQLHRYSLCQVIGARIPTWTCLTQQNHVTGQNKSPRSQRMLLNTVVHSVLIVPGRTYNTAWLPFGRVFRGVQPSQVPWHASCEHAQQQTHLVNNFPPGYGSFLLICYLAQVTTT